MRTCTIYYLIENAENQYTINALPVGLFHQELSFLQYYLLSLGCVCFFPLKVRKTNLSKEESLVIMGHSGSGPEVLANETLMKEGQVIRSTTNQVSIHYRSLRQSNHGTFSLHYQGKIISF